MFQNISDSYEEEENEHIENNEKKQIIKQLLNKQNIIIYILSFMVSTVSFSGEIAPFGLALLAACCSNSVPIGIIYILSAIGTWIGTGADNFLIYLLISIIFMIMSLIFKGKYNKETDRINYGVQICASCVIGKLVKMLFGPFLLYDLIQAIIFSIAVVVFYKIFVSSINVLKDFRIKKVFSVEEVIGTSLLLGIAVCGFKEFQILGFSVRNILSILIVLILGWQNGMLIGGTAGITIGVLLGIIANGTPLQIASYATSGLIAGVLNKLGKIGVIIGFIIGNGILAYVGTGNTEQVIILKEIIIASIGLLAIPKQIKINIEDIIDKKKYLPVMPEKTLEYKAETIYKLNNVSEAISEVAKTYQDVAATTVEEEEVDLENRHIFIEELKNNMKDIKENALYEPLENSDNIQEQIYNKVVTQEYITDKDIIKIYEDNNYYILGFDEDSIDPIIKEDIDKIVKIVNYAYRISKINFVWKRKNDDDKKTMGAQLDGISKTISSIAENINQENQEENYEEKEQIKKILSQKGIEISDINIKKDKYGKMYANIFLDACTGENIKLCKSDTIQEVISKILKQKMILQNDNCATKENKTICNLKYTTEDRYKLLLGIARATKAGSPVSGDSTIQMKLEDGKYLIAISDGMGSGPNARKSSKIATKMLQRLFTSGFEKDIAIDLINSSINLNLKDETYATLDIAILDLYNGNIEFIKNGACPTYIKNRKKVDTVKNISLPAGILNNIELNVYDRDIENNDILVMCSDGIIESNTEYQNKELWLKYLLEEMETDDVQKIADIIINEAIDNDFGKQKDDMTVVVAKMVKAH